MWGWPSCAFRWSCKLCSWHVFFQLLPSSVTNPTHWNTTVKFCQTPWNVVDSSFHAACGAKKDPADTTRGSRASLAGRSHKAHRCTTGKGSCQFNVDLSIHASLPPERKAQTHSKPWYRTDKYSICLLARSLATGHFTCPPVTCHLPTGGSREVAGPSG